MPASWQRLRCPRKEDAAPVSNQRLQRLRCPFCGSRDVYVLAQARDWRLAHAIICPDCGARGPLAESAAEARQAWERFA